MNPANVRQTALTSTVLLPVSVKKHDARHLTVTANNDSGRYTSRKQRRVTGKIKMLLSEYMFW
jgi:hypothetical protein